MTTNTRVPNRLANEKSPYLLQHAHNPVDWYPWGDEAFNKANAEDKPIFLSIGYSTCHWCHVMERESFEDEEVAALLNQNFISIKVDREERPDVDTIYMSVCQAMTGHGGWPLTIMMTPDKKPFFAGTYFPKHSQQGIPGVMDIFGNASKLWNKDRASVLSSGDNITKVISESYFEHNSGKVDRETLDQAYQYYVSSFDSEYGGFGRAPKFPTPHNLTFLLRYWKLTGEAKALEMVEKTLEQMYRGGIYDHIGFGFSRYSTDQYWLVPHFEKMLYDNALLAIALLETYQATGKEFYSRAVKEVFTYVLRDMTSYRGGFFSAEDADSEGEEGKFYVWSPEEVIEVLGAEKGEEFCRVFDITPKGNFEGKSIPNLITHGLEGDFRVEGNKLFLHRESRVHPFKDDKILTAWNGLMIAAMAIGGRVLKEDQLSAAAGNAADFVLRYLRREDGRLLARYRDGEAAIPAFADDYAFMVWGLIELYEATFQVDYLKEALSLNREMIYLFWDKEKGGLFQTGFDAEELISRPKEIYDGAIPSGNSVAAHNMLRLAAITGDRELEEKAQKQLEAFGGSVAETPPGHAHFLSACYLGLVKSEVLTIVEARGNEEQTQEFMTEANRQFNPARLVIVKLSGSEGDKLSSVVPEAAEKNCKEQKTTAYLCRNNACQPPVTSAQELKKALSEATSKILPK